MQLRPFFIIWCLIYEGISSVNVGFGLCSCFFQGELRTSAVTGRLEPHFPKWKRNLFFYTVSLPVMAICHCFIVLVCFNFFTLYDIINDRIKSGQLYFFFKPVPNIFLAVAVMVMDKVYGSIAVWLNDKGLWLQLNVIFSVLWMFSVVHLHTLSCSNPHRISTRPQKDRYVMCMHVTLFSLPAANGICPETYY